jgi:hypothetical protein
MDFAEVFMVNSLGMPFGTIFVTIGNGIMLFYFGLQYK